MKKILLLFVLAFSTALVAQNRYHKIDSLLNYKLQKMTLFLEYAKRETLDRKKNEGDE